MKTMMIELNNVENIEYLRKYSTVFRKYSPKKPQNRENFLFIEFFANSHKLLLNNKITGIFNEPKKNIFSSPNKFNIDKVQIIP